LVVKPLNSCKKRGLQQVSVSSLHMFEKLGQKEFCPSREASRAPDNFPLVYYLTFPFSINSARTG
jgi:hypothetical protein